MKIGIRWAKLCLPGVLLLLVSCVDVAPWERGTLAKQQMSIEPYPLQSQFRRHTYVSREAGAIIDSSGGGGGCGCY